MMTIQVLQALGMSFLGRGRHQEASPFFDRAIEMSTRTFGPEHTVTVLC
jgi:uncharacterized protein HemY